MHCIKDQLDSRVLSKFNFPPQTNKQTKRTSIILDGNCSSFKITTKSKSVQLSELVW